MVPKVVVCCWDDVWFCENKKKITPMADHEKFCTTAILPISPPLYLILNSNLVVSKTISR